MLSLQRLLLFQEHRDTVLLDEIWYEHRITDGCALTRYCFPMGSSSNAVFSTDDARLWWNRQRCSDDATRVAPSVMPGKFSTLTYRFICALSARYSAR
jgi:hypothetical protein